jgi:UDP-N-acetylmuramyl pentapeptide phosphotransferase/UDP-N-acetylglucosamine-1-phosphate transferase
MIRPILLRHALAKPNARSSHTTPTPQGAGIAVVAATLFVASLITAFEDPVQAYIPAAVLFGTLFIAIVGFADDVKPVPVLPRLMLQALAVGVVVYSAPADLTIIPVCPLWLERGLILLAGLWFVNLVNFMDGLDWMMVAEVVPITGAMIMLGWLGELSGPATTVAAALCGAMVGFAPFNRPVAKVFLGDVGSLPIGLLLGWGLLQLTYHQQYTAALLLPLYYVADATVTLLRRLIGRQPFWTAHRSHFYQRATDNGVAVFRVIGEVFVLNAGLAVMAVVSTRTPAAAGTVLMVIGSAAVALTMYRFSRPRRF